MTTDRPPAGSPWAALCPDAYPAEWYDALGLTALPPGFGRFATDDEADVITGRTAAPARPEPHRRAPSANRWDRDKPTAPGRFGVLNGFADYSLAGLTGSDVKTWLILFRDTKADGTARTGQRDIARRAGLKVRVIQKAVARLEAKGLLEVVRRGRLNSGVTVYRVHPRGSP
jgi:hypothetical protein